MLALGASGLVPSGVRILPPATAQPVGIWSSIIALAIMRSKRVCANPFPCKNRHCRFAPAYVVLSSIAHKYFPITASLYRHYLVLNPRPWIISRMLFSISLWSLFSKNSALIVMLFSLLPELLSNSSMHWTLSFVFFAKSPHNV